MQFWQAADTEGKNQTQNEQVFQLKLNRATERFFGVGKGNQMFAENADATTGRGPYEAAINASTEAASPGYDCENGS